jgi:hypothetical protein
LLAQKRSFLLFRPPNQLPLRFHAVLCIRVSV